MNNKFYVYIHVNTQTKEPFYVGKGAGNRAYVKTRRSKRWKSYVDKYGFEVEIYKENLSDVEALASEIELIKKSLERNKGKRKAAADELGISERTLYRKIKQYNL
jgi:transcriptional regulator with PAS, ATPase and Fis domain